MAVQGEAVDGEMKGMHAKAEKGDMKSIIGLGGMFASAYAEDR